VLVARGETLITVGKTKDAPDSIVMEEAQHYGANDIVQAGTQPPARDNPAFQFGRIEIDLLPGTRLFKRGWTLSNLEIFFDCLQVVVKQNMIAFRHMPPADHGRGYAAFPQF
jgi:hypothetical protein